MISPKCHLCSGELAFDTVHLLVVVSFKPVDGFVVETIRLLLCRGSRCCSLGLTMTLSLGGRAHKHGVRLHGKILHPTLLEAS